jgi:hypothetical protein
MALEPRNRIYEIIRDVVIGILIPIIGWFAYEVMSLRVTITRIEERVVTSVQKIDYFERGTEALKQKLYDMDNQIKVNTNRLERLEKGH